MWGWSQHLWCFQIICIYIAFAKTKPHHICMQICAIITIIWGIFTFFVIALQGNFDLHLDCEQIWHYFKRRAISVHSLDGTTMNYHKIAVHCVYSHVDTTWANVDEASLGTGNSCKKLLLDKPIQKVQRKWCQMLK